MLVALAGGPGVVLYSLQQGETRPQLPSKSAWRMSQQARLSHMWPACAVSMSADGNVVAAAALGGQLSVWDLRDGPGAACLELQVLCHQQAAVLPAANVVCVLDHVLLGWLLDPKSCGCKVPRHGCCMKDAKIAIRLVKVMLLPAEPLRNLKDVGSCLSYPSC